MYRLSARSLTKLSGVHPDLVKCVLRAIQLTTVDFSVTEGVRTLARQKYLFSVGKSRTMNSRHLTGHAVDLAPWVNGTIDWDSPAGYTGVSTAMKQAAREFRIPVEWGFDLWKWDKPHYQLRLKEYS